MKKYLLILAIILVVFFAFYFSRTNKINAPVQTPTIDTPTLAVKEASVKDQVIKALSQKNNWDVSRVELNVATVEGNFAKGDVKFKGEMGGGLWFAAKVNGTWKIVYDGNGMITCDQLSNYQNFPKDLIPVCFDKQTEKILTR